LHVSDVKGLSPAAARSDPRPPAAGFIADQSFTIDSPAAAATLRSEPLAAAVSASVATRLLIDESGTEWITVIDYQIGQGSIQSLELRVPAALGAVQIEGEAIRQRSVRAAGIERIWRIELQEPRWNPYRLLLRARLDDAAGRAMPVPLVRPHGVDDSRQYLLVQTSSDRPMAVRGAEQHRQVAADLFAKWFSEPITGNLLVALVLHEAGNPIELHAAAGQVAPGAPAPVLERHQTWLRSPEELLTESQVVFQSRAAGVATIAVPAGTRILEMRLDGQPTQPTMNDRGEISVWLDAAYRPHEIMLRWTWQPAARGQSTTALSLPRLTDSSCPSIWTIHSARGVVNPEFASGVCRSLAEAIQAQALAEQIARMLPPPKDIDSIQRGEVLSDMERALLAAIGSARRAIEIEAEIGLPSRRLRAAHDRAVTQLARLSDQNRQLLERFGLGSLAARLELGARSPLLAGPLVVSISDDAAISADTIRFGPIVSRGAPGGEISYAVTNEGPVILKLRTDSPDQARREQIGWSIFAGLTGCFAGLVFASRSARRAVLISLIVAGLFWCWFLNPPPVGPALLLLAASVAIVGLVRSRRSSRQAVQAGA